MAVAIAAQACLPVLRLGLQPYDGFVGIVVHPDEVRVRREFVDDDGIVHEYDDVLAGEAMEGGPVMLSWRDVSEAGESAQWGYNVVVHEFAHVLDMGDGVADGMPPLATAERRAPLAGGADRPTTKTSATRVDAGEDTVLDPYGAESPEEFFAVASEAFFVAPQAMRAEHPALYALLAGYYRQDPARQPEDQAAVISGRALSLFFGGWMSSSDFALVVDVHRQAAAVDQPAEQQLVGQRTPDRVLDQALHRPRAHQRVEALLRQVLAQRVGEGDLDLLLGQLAFELQQELVDHAQDDVLVERTEADTIASSRLRNSGVNSRLMSAISSPDSRGLVKPMVALFIVSAPALVVMTMMTLRKSALRPLLSVSVPWSITCSSTLKTSGCAFSISSSSSTACGFLLIASVSRPPWSKPT